jgi:hypothetical protein
MCEVSRFKNVVRLLSPDFGVMDTAGQALTMLEGIQFVQQSLRNFSILLSQKEILCGKRLG